MKKIYLKGLTFMLIMTMFGCDSITSNHTENTNEDDTINQEEKENQQKNNNPSNAQEDVVENNDSNIERHTGSTETVIRKVEGMDQEVKVIHYQIQPYAISYQLDDFFGAPDVSNNQITYSTQNDQYKINLEIIQHTNLEKAVSNLQEKYEVEGFKEEGELESTPLEENNLKGKMQFYAYPIKGFYVYEIDEHVLVITYQYPVEGGDGMLPLLEAFRKSIDVQ